MKYDHFINSKFSNEELLEYRKKVEGFIDENPKKIMLDGIDREIKKRGLKFFDYRRNQ